MIAAVVYVLCTVASALCAMLLLRHHRRQRSRLLFWSGLSFAGFAVANALVFADFVVLPDVDLSLVRAATGLLSIAILLFGLVWEAD
jgi:cytochrome bd-type quinol oxidase subunit 2